MVGNGFSHSIEPTDATLAAVKEMLRRAWLTLLSIENTSRGPAPPRTAWPSFPADSNTAYAATPLSVRTFSATPQDRTNYLDVLGWFAEYVNPTLDPQIAPIPERIETVRIFKAWVCGASMWQLQQRMTTNRRQPASKSLVYKRIDGMVYWITMAHSQEIDAMLKTFRVDRVREVDQKPGPPMQVRRSLESDLRDLPNSPKFWRAPDAKPLRSDHPDAVAARQREADQAAAVEKQRKRARRHQKRDNGRKAEGDEQGSPGSPGGPGPQPAAFKSAA
jgi:hypothetical protein